MGFVCRVRAEKCEGRERRERGEREREREGIRRQRSVNLTNNVRGFVQNLRSLLLLVGS
jgi:hypothetical protein